MKNFRYTLTETAADGGLSVYGIALWIRRAGGWQTVHTVKDISLDKEAVAALAERCQRLHLSPVHLMDVIEDFLARD